MESKRGDGAATLNNWCSSDSFSTCVMNRLKTNKWSRIVGRRPLWLICPLFSFHHMLACVWIGNTYVCMWEFKSEAEGRRIAVNMCGRYNSFVRLLSNHNAPKFPVPPLRQTLLCRSSGDGWLDTSFTIRHGSCSCCEPWDFTAPVLPNGCWGALREQQNSERTLQIQLSRKRRPLTFYIRTLSFTLVCSTHNSSAAAQSKFFCPNTP